MGLEPVTVLPTDRSSVGLVDRRGGVAQLRHVRAEAIGPEHFRARPCARSGLRGRFGNYVPPVLGLAEVEHNARNNRMRAR